MRIMLNNVRLAFPDLFVPRAGGRDGSGKKKFGASFILPKNHPQVAEINAAIDAVAKEKWAEKAPVILKALRAQDKVCLHDGDLKAQYGGFEGNFYVSARSDIRPTVFGQDKLPLSEDSGKPYAGCYVNVSLEIWPQEHKEFGKRVNAQLRGVQFLRDGDSFSAGSAASDDEFADVSDTGSDDNDPTK